MNDPRNDTLIRLAALRDSLTIITKPEILRNLVDLAQFLGTDHNSFVKQFKFWVEKNGNDCRYAAMAKEFFLKDQAKDVAKQINYLYHNFSKQYEDK